MVQATGRGRKFVFVSYAHQDGRPHLKELEASIPSLGGSLPLEIWSDDRLQPGEKWADVLGQVIGKAAVIVVLVTRQYLRSRFVEDEEWPKIKGLAEAEEVRIIPVLCEPCLWKRSPLSSYELANSPSRSGRIVTISELRGAARKAEWVLIAEKLIEIGRVGTRLTGPIVEHYELVHTVYRNDYSLTHYKLTVKAPSPTEIPHYCYQRPIAGRNRKWPSIDELCKNSRALLPYPTLPFLAMASQDKLAFHLIRRKGSRRQFKVVLPTRGRWRYQWMWGAPEAAKENKQVPGWVHVALAGRGVKHCKIRLRIQNGYRSKVAPFWSYIEPKGPGDFYPDSRHGAKLTQVEQAPLFSCYELDLHDGQLEETKDILCVY